MITPLEPSRYYADVADAKHGHGTSASGVRIDPPQTLSLSVPTAQILSAYDPGSHLQTTPDNRTNGRQ